MFKNINFLLPRLKFTYPPVPSFLNIESLPTSTPIVILVIRIASQILNSQDQERGECRLASERKRKRGRERKLDVRHMRSRTAQEATSRVSGKSPLRQSLTSSSLSSSFLSFSTNYRENTISHPWEDLLHLLSPLLTSGRAIISAAHETECRHRGATRAWLQMGQRLGREGRGWAKTGTTMGTMRVRHRGELGAFDRKENTTITRRRVLTLEIRYPCQRLTSHHHSASPRAGNRSRLTYFSNIQ